MKKLKISMFRQIDIFDEQQNKISEGLIIFDNRNKASVITDCELKPGEFFFRETTEPLTFVASEMVN